MITNVQAVKFCNEKVRPAADALGQAYETLRRLKMEWDATLMANLIPNDTTVIADGADTDGRKPITGQMVYNILNRGFEYMTDQEANFNAKLNTIKQVTVNDAPRF
jgi:hypothetical protein